MTATVNSPDWSAVVAGYEDGSFDSGIVWSNNAPTPYQYYRGVMSTETVQPVGEQTFQNYHRFGFRRPTRSSRVRCRLRRERAGEQMNQLQALFAENAPVVPLFPGPSGARTTPASPASRPRTTPTPPSATARHARSWC